MSRPNPNQFQQLVPTGDQQQQQQSSSQRITRSEQTTTRQVTTQQRGQFQSGHSPLIRQMRLRNVEKFSVVHQIFSFMV